LLYKGEDLKMSGTRYTWAVGQKFNEDGSVRRFAGNTCISRITEDMPLYTGLMEVQKRMKALECAGKYGFLPPSSFHMTVIEGVCDQVRKAERWSSKLPLDTPLEEFNQRMLEWFAKLSPPDSFTMRVAGADFSKLQYIALEAASQETTLSLKEFRDAFSEETGIRFPDHDTYRFHMSLAYKLIHLTPEEEEVIKENELEVQQELVEKYPTFKLPSPVLTVFDNMFRFDDAC